MTNSSFYFFISGSVISYSHLSDSVWWW